MADDATVMAIFDDLASRFGETMTASQVALCKCLSEELAKDSPDIDTVMRLERLLPRPRVPEITVKFVAGRPLRHADGTVRGWDESDEVEHRKALIEVDHPSVPEQFRRRSVPRDAVPPFEAASEARREAVGGGRARGGRRNRYSGLASRGCSR